MATRAELRKEVDALAHEAKVHWDEATKKAKDLENKIEVKTAELSRAQ